MVTYSPGMENGKGFNGSKYLLSMILSADIGRYFGASRNTTCHTLPFLGWGEVFEKKTASLKG